MINQHAKQRRSAVTTAKGGSASVDGSRTRIQRPSHLSIASGEPL